MTRDELIEKMALAQQSAAMRWDNWNHGLAQPPVGVQVRPRPQFIASAALDVAAEWLEGEAEGSQGSIADKAIRRLIAMLKEPVT